MSIQNINRNECHSVGYSNNELNNSNQIGRFPQITHIPNTSDPLNIQPFGKKIPVTEQQQAIINQLTNTYNTITLQSLKDNGITREMLEQNMQGNRNPLSTLLMHLTIQECKEFGNYTWQEFKNAGRTASELRLNGALKQDLINIPYPLEEIIEAEATYDIEQTKATIAKNIQHITTNLTLMKQNASLISQSQINKLLTLCDSITKTADDFNQQKQLVQKLQTQIDNATIYNCFSTWLTSKWKAIFSSTNSTTNKIQELQTQTLDNCTQLSKLYNQNIAREVIKTSETGKLNNTKFPCYDSDVAKEVIKFIQQYVKDTPINNTYLQTFLLLKLAIVIQLATGNPSTGNLNKNTSQHLIKTLLKQYNIQELFKYVTGQQCNLDDILTQANLQNASSINLTQNLNHELLQILTGKYADDTGYNAMLEQYKRPSIDRLRQILPK